TYWTCQVLGWGSYTAVGVAGVVNETGWRPPVGAGYVAFFFFSIALTDLFRHEILRRQWLNSHTGRLFGALTLGIVVVGSIQCFLISAVDLALQGSSNFFAQHPGNVLRLWVGAMGVTFIWTILYVALTAQRRSRDKEVHMQLAVREAELRA